MYGAKKKKTMILSWFACIFSQLTWDWNSSLEHSWLIGEYLLLLMNDLYMQYCDVSCRKKRKWDQPAESLLNFPLASFGISLPGVPVAPVVPAPAAAAFFTNPPVASGATVPPVVLQGPLPPKFNQVRYVT